MSDRLLEAGRVGGGLFTSGEVSAVSTTPAGSGRETLKTFWQLEQRTLTVGRFILY